MFRTITKGITDLAGSPVAVIGAILIVLVWAVIGPIFEFSDTWQLTINTGTTILTFIMVFVIQATQNRNDAAVQVKLDELVRAVGKARKNVIDLEDEDEKVIERLHDELKRRKATS